MMNTCLRTLVAALGFTALAASAQTKWDMPLSLIHICHADHRRVERIGIARNQRLHGLHQRAAGQHHIHRLMRHRGMATASGDADIEAIGRCV